VYRRGSLSAELTAWVSSAESSTVEANGVTVNIKARPFSFVRAEVILAGQKIEPRSGDIIEQVIAGVIESYEVMPLGNEPESAWRDVYGVMIEVYCKRVKLANA
jgi:hypothetical protein